MLSKQEMFNRAYLGLRSQGFVRCVNKEGYCRYSDNGKHCSWGWVDQNLDENRTGSVYNLNRMHIGEASLLDDEHLKFANDLQNAHDHADEPNIMKSDLHSLAITYNLKVPNAE
jgi:hypothetical protein